MDSLKEKYMSSLLNRKYTKMVTLDLVKSRSHEFTRVSPEFLNRVEAQIRNFIEAEIQRLPSVGKTIK